MFIKVFVTPGARKEKVEEKGDTLVLLIREPAARNAANMRVRELISARFNKPIRAVRILTGHRSRAKIISIDS